jgi:hypothetical protein
MFVIKNERLSEMALGNGGKLDDSQITTVSVTRRW